MAADSVSVVEMTDRTGIIAGDRFVAGFVDIDGAAAGVSRQLLAEKGADKNQSGDRFLPRGAQPAYPADPYGICVRRHGVVGDSTADNSRSIPQAGSVAARRLRSRNESLEAQSHQIVQAGQLRTALQSLLKGPYVLAVPVPRSYFFLQFVLGLYPCRRGRLRRDYCRSFWYPLQAMGAVILESLPGIAFVVILGVADAVCFQTGAAVLRRHRARHSHA